MRIGMAAGQVFNRGSHRHRVVVGKDTRLSGYMIEQALTHYQRAAPPLPRVYANEYAVSLLTHSLKLIGQLPASSARNSSLNAQVMPLQ